MASAENAASGSTARDPGRGHHHRGHAHDEPHADGTASVRDPVCGMTVDPATSRYRFDYSGNIFHFYRPGGSADASGSRT